MMNFSGLPTGFHGGIGRGGPGGGGVGNGGSHMRGPGEMLMEPGMLPQEGFHEGQNVGPMFHGQLPPEMDYRAVHKVLDCPRHYPVTAVCFDANQELLWAGTQRGHMASYYGMDFHKYTAFQVSPAEDAQLEIRQTLSIESGVLSLTSTRLRFTHRRGLPIYSVSDSDMQHMQCMIHFNSDTILMGGHQKKIIEFNTRKGQIVNKYEVGDAGCAVFRQAGKYLCAGDTAGKVTLYDPSTMRKEHVLDAHSSMLSDFDVHGHLLVTCGYSKRMNNLVADRLLMVYDMRVMRAMAPIQSSIDPTYLRFLPHIPNQLIIVSQMGNFQLTDTTAMTPSMMIFPVDTQGAAISSFDMSQTCQALAFGDSAGHVHLFANNEHAVFNGFQQPTEFSVPFEPPINGMHIMDELASFTSVPMMYPANEPLLSDWPVSMTRKVNRRPKPIDPEILRSMKLVHNVHCVPNPGKTRRNQVPYKLGKEDGTKRQLSVPESPSGRVDDPFKTVPKTYQRMLMRYTKLDDFDFCHYNKTKFAGLIAEYANSYCNAMLQVLYFVEPLRAALLSHICQREFCLACELGFLFHMLDTKMGEACQAKNFLRAFRTIPEASALSLVLTEAEEASGEANLLRLTPSWHRFMLHQIHLSQQETCQQSDPPPESSPPDKEKENEKEKETAAAEAAAEKKLEPGGKSKKKKKGGKQVAAKGKKKDDGKMETPDAAEEKSAAEESAKPADEQQEQESLKLEEVSVPLDLFAFHLKSSLLCRCGLETWRDVQTMLITLSYPHLPPSDQPQAVMFGEVLHHSLTGQSMMQAWCNECDRYQQHVHRRKVCSLPDILSIDCHLTNEKHQDFWRTQMQILKDQAGTGDESQNPAIPKGRPKTKCRYGVACRRNDCRYWHENDAEREKANDSGDAYSTSQFGPSWIPLGLRVKLMEDGDVRVDEILDEEPLPKDEAMRREFYEIFAVVYSVQQQDAGRHLVSCIKGSEPYHQRKERVTCHQWYLFNDFCIQPIEKPENIAVDLEWKVPILVYYNRRNYLQDHDTKVRSWCRPDILYNDPALANPKRRKITFLPLQHDETLQKGDLVGLDAEFISLKDEEAELRSDGTKSTIKPSHNSPGRITCIRGQGDHIGEPFIDDYILTPEQVTDYLTEFSGIEPSELDPSTSTKHLTTLKSSYQKLRCLLDIGVVFVGHGLKKDFKVINLQVPKDQIIDTVQLFNLPRQRFVSLRFLAWFFLNKTIQSSSHDSVEDARTALQLYLRYRELSAEGPDKAKAAIKELYETGRKLAWKIPDSDDGPGWKGPEMEGDYPSEEDILDSSASYQ